LDILEGSGIFWNLFKALYVSDLLESSGIYLKPYMSRIFWNILGFFEPLNSIWDVLEGPGFFWNIF